jgi:hypothetical protein
MTSVQLWAMLIGLLVPFVAGLLMKKSWASAWKFLIALVTAAVVGVGSVAVAGDLHLGADYVVVTIGAVLAAGQASFYFIVDKVTTQGLALRPLLA